MRKELAKHPSNIAQSALAFLETLKVSAKTKRVHQDVLFFFVESLLSDPSAVAEGEDGEYLLTSNWSDYYGGVISSFVDWWLARKVMDETLQLKAPGVLRQWLKWCYQHDYFDKTRYEDFLEGVPGKKRQEIKRLQEAGELLYRLHTPNPGAWMAGGTGRVLSIENQKEPEDWEEGYMASPYRNGKIVR